MSFSAPTHIAQIAITVGDVERAKAWYRDRLGLTHLFDASPGLSFLQCGSTRLMLSRPEPRGPVTNSILYFAVPDIDAAYRTMIDAGVTSVVEPRRVAEVSGREIWIAFCRDTEGNLVALTEEK